MDVRVVCRAVAAADTSQHFRPFDRPGRQFRLSTRSHSAGTSQRCDYLMMHRSGGPEGVEREPPASTPIALNPPPIILADRWQAEPALLYYSSCGAVEPTSHDSRCAGTGLSYPERHNVWPP